MTNARTSPTRNAWGARAHACLAHPGAVWVVVLGLLAARVVWLVFFSELTLSEDEAHYWDWSRRPDWSYYSKGPGVAWLIALSTAVFGHSEWAVRLPAVISGAVGMLGAAATARWVFPEERALPALGALAWALVPGFAVASVLMTIDAPYLACWAWGGAFAAAALVRGWRWAWLGLGVCVALGLLFKHTIVLLPIGVALAAWAVRRERAPVAWRWVGLGGSVALLGLLPTLVWNAANGWVTARHLLGHLSLPGGDTVQADGFPWSPVWTAEYLAVQAPVVGGAVVLVAMAWWRSRRHSNSHAVVLALVWIGAPVFAFYLLVSLRTRVEGNWAMAGASTWAVGAAWAAGVALRDGGRWTKVVWWLTAATGALVIAAPAMLGFLSTRRVFGPSIPIDRVTGMREHAGAAGLELDRLRAETGLEPFVMTDHYGRAALLAFYLPGRPVVLCASASLGGRRSQYDLWADTNPVTAAGLGGRPALLFGRRDQAWDRWFGRVEWLGTLPGEPKPGSRGTFAGHGFARPGTP